MPSRKPRVNLTLEPEAMQNLELLSKAMGRPMATIVKEMIEPMLEQTNHLLEITKGIEKDKAKLKQLEDSIDKGIEDLNSEAKALVMQMRIKMDE